MTAGAGFVTGAVNLGTSTGTNPPAGIGNIDQTTKTKMKMNFNKDAIVYCIVQGLGAAIILWLCLHLVGCKTIQQQTAVHNRDSVNIIIKHWPFGRCFFGAR